MASLMDPRQRINVGMGLAPSWCPPSSSLNPHPGTSYSNASWLLLAFAPSWCPHPQPGISYSHASWLLLAFAPSWCPQSSSFITLRSSHLPHPLNAILFPPIHVWDRAPSIRL